MQIKKHIPYCQNLFNSRPKWMENGDDNSPNMWAYLAELIERKKPKVMCEVGVSSGATSALLLLSAKKYNSDAMLYGFDINDKVYFDTSHNVGDGFFDLASELHKDYKLLLNTTTLQASTYIKEKIDFVFIDGNHSHPWAIIDTLLLYPHIKEDAIVVFHDTGHPIPYEQAGLFAVAPFTGVKNISSHNIGYIDLSSVSEKETFDWIYASLQIPWQAAFKPQELNIISEQISTHLSKEEILRFSTLLKQNNENVLISLPHLQLGKKLQNDYIDRLNSAIIDVNNELYNARRRKGLKRLFNRIKNIFL